ncbi:MAG: UDP-N-acetylmuramoyl-L-alanine--D-glutamate ligase [Acidobacteriaceae bacterium]
MLDTLSDKKIAILGMGINNKYLADFLTRQGINYDVIDQWKDLKEVEPLLRQYQIVFRTPGVPYLSPLIQNTIKAGVEIYSQTKLFFDICPCPIIGVTGTKGKGTTSSLIFKILQKAGKKAWLAGNIGQDPFEFLEMIVPDDFVVLELSSFQLQDLHKSPHIAVVLNITSDHVNPKLDMRTHYSQKEYVEAKSAIVKFQGPQDTAILHPDLPDWFKQLGEAKKLLIDPQSAERYETKLLGRHNLENIAAATEVGRILEVGDNEIAAAVSEFDPLPHRLQLVGTKNDITYVDDSISTNIDSTIAAIKSFPQYIVLIAGGYDKGHDYGLLADVIIESKNVIGVVAVGQVADRIEKALKGFQGQVLTGAKNMKEMVEQARSIAQPGDIILLSPAAASFDMFKDAKDRGAQFIAEANS